MIKRFFLLALMFFAVPAFGIEYADLSTPKEPAYRVGTTDDIENKYEVKTDLKTDIVKNSSDIEGLNELTYADLSIKKMSMDISKELELEQGVMLEDLSLLWQGAAAKSETVKFALYKLSNPDADKPDEKSVKKVLSTIASMSTLVGAGIGNPILASGAFMGSSILGAFSQDEKALNYKYTKVNDADMILLVRKIDELQQSVVTLYYEYMTTRKMLDMSIQMLKTRYNNFQTAQDSSKEIVIIADAYYREGLDLQNKCRSDFFSKRSSLEQLVGPDVFKQFEEGVIKRENAAE